MEGLEIRVENSKKLSGLALLRSDKTLLNTVISQYNDLLTEEHLSPAEAYENIANQFREYGLKRTHVRKAIKNASLDGEKVINLSKKPREVDILRFKKQESNIIDNYYSLKDNGLKGSEALEVIAKGLGVKKHAVRKIVNRDIEEVTQQEKLQIFEQYAAINKKGSKTYKVKDIARKFNISSGKVRKIAESLNGTLYNSSMTETPENFLVHTSEGTFLAYEARNYFDKDALTRAESLIQANEDKLKVKDTLTKAESLIQAREERSKIKDTIKQEFGFSDNLLKRYLRKAKSNIRATAKKQVIENQNKLIEVQRQRSMEETIDSELVNIGVLFASNVNHYEIHNILDYAAGIAYGHKKAGQSNDKIRETLSKEFGKRKYQGLGRFSPRESLKENELSEKNMDKLISYGQSQAQRREKYLASLKNEASQTPKNKPIEQPSQLEFWLDEKIDGINEKIEVFNKKGVKGLASSVFQDIGRGVYSELRPVLRRPYQESEFESLGKKSLAIAASLMTAVTLALSYGYVRDKIDDFKFNHSTHSRVADVSLNSVR